jgi:putative chitinase
MTLHNPKRLFDLIRRIKGSPLSQSEVVEVNRVLAEDGAHQDARTLKNVEAFWKAVRAVTGSLVQVQVDVVNALLAKAAHWPTSWLAYALATGWHEARLKPIEEWGKGRGHKYGVPGKHGQVAYGRGLVQLTWDFNYQKADDELDLHGALIKDYAMALRPDIAVAIMVRGMEEGWFTAKSLKTYLPDETGTVEQFANARRIINGTDKASLIAGYAERFQDALKAGGWAP